MCISLPVLLDNRWLCIPCYGNYWPHLVLHSYTLLVNGTMNHHILYAGIKVCYWFKNKNDICDPISIAVRLQKVLGCCTMSWRCPHTVQTVHVHALKHTVKAMAFNPPLRVIVWTPYHCRGKSTHSFGFYRVTYCRYSTLALLIGDICS